MMPMDDMMMGGGFNMMPELDLAQPLMSQQRPRQMRMVRTMARPQR